jgi:hypothetical protein
MVHCPAGCLKAADKQKRLFARRKSSVHGELHVAYAITVM